MAAASSSTRRPAESDGTDVDTLRALNDGFIRAVASSDAGWFEAHLSSDFVNSNADGTLSERAAFIAHVARPSSVPDLVASDVRIRLFGATAIVHGRTSYTRPDGQRGAGRYTDVWARVEGRWLCVAADVTRC
jgi:ketosteroid isomerase-like protein